MSAWGATLSGWFTAVHGKRQIGAAGAPGRARLVRMHHPSVRRCVGFDQPLVWVVVALLLWGW
jgi:hypothetical protein